MHTNIMYINKLIIRILGEVNQKNYQYTLKGNVVYRLNNQ